MLDVIIIGSGPAGLGAAIYAKRAGLKVLVLEKNPMSGGQVLNTEQVDNYLGLPQINGFEMGMKFREHAESLGVEFVETEVISLQASGDIKIVECTTQTYQSEAVILAMGAEHMMLNVPGEELLRGKGVSYCATCDGAFFRGKTVAVVGGGDVAVEDALFLSRICQKVYVIHRRNALRAAKSLQDKLFASENVEILWNSQLKEITGEDSVSAICVGNKETGEEKQYEADGVFIAVGMKPTNTLIANQIRTDEKGYVVAAEDCRTSLPGVYVVGDLRTKQVRQIITAVSDGANCIYSLEYDRNTTKSGMEINGKLLF